MKKKQKELIQYLAKQTDWVDSQALCAVFGLSARMIRNYIKDIRAQYPDLILSSFKGYQVNHAQLNQLADEQPEETGEIDILRRLIRSQGSISVYDLADELYVSDTQLERLLNSVKTFLSRFQLTIKRKRNRISITGEELNKRKLIHYLIADESFSGFVLVRQIDAFFDDDHLVQIKEQLQNILKANQLQVDDYGFHSILIHLLIIILRVKNNNILYEEENSPQPNALLHREQRAACQINALILELYHFSLSETELRYFSFILSGNARKNSDSLITPDNLANYIPAETITVTNQILNDLKDNYCLDAFSEDFKLNFALHINNLLGRASTQTYTQNPLAKSFKEQYPLIYDMAAFVVKELNDYQAFRITDDEIAFIAFHIGTYLEKNAEAQERLTCCFLYANYHNSFEYALQKLNQEFHSLLSITDAISISQTQVIPESCDLVITCVGRLPHLTIPCVEVSPLMAQADLAEIRSVAEKIKVQRQKEKIRDILNIFIGKQLFKKEYYCANALEMIKNLGQECQAMNLCDEDYIEHVLERERLSSTSFKNRVAIPHALSPCAKHPFLSIVSNTKPMQWGDYEVNIIVLIGVSKTDKTMFKMILDSITQLLYEVDHVLELSKCQTYNEFIDKLIELLD